MFPSLDIPVEYWIEHITFGLLYAMFRFSTMIFYREVPGFATDWPCGYGVADLPRASCMLVHFLKNYFEMIVGL